MRLFIFGLLVAALASGSVYSRSEAAEASEPNILVSTKPLSSIISSVTLGSNRQVRVLLLGGSSPHNYVLSSENIRQINRANVIFWVGPMLEKFLVVPLANPALRATAVTLADAEGVKLLPRRIGAEWDAGVPAEELSESDSHIWLDIDNAIAIARKTARVLSQADPINARLYAGNAECGDAPISSSTTDTNISRPIMGWRRSALFPFRR
jgi:zinc transport system substrate-binding protein